MTSIPHISGLREVADKYDCFFLDIFGLLHNGQRINPGTIECLKQLKAHNKKTCLVSNTPRLADGVPIDFVKYGINREYYDHIVTAGESARIELNETYRDKKVLFFGKALFIGLMEGLGLHQVNTVEDADFILNAIPGIHDFTEEQIIAFLHKAKDKNLPMVCANPDLVVHIGDVLHTCAGTYAALYEQIGGNVSYHGKPYTQIYDLARNLVGNPPKEKICAIGDALGTDIKGANQYGIDSIWALTGIHWEELRYEHDPGVPDPLRVVQTLAASSFKPTATITGFSW